MLFFVNNIILFYMIFIVKGLTFLAKNGIIVQVILYMGVIFMTRYNNVKLVIMDEDDVLFDSSPLIQKMIEEKYPQFSARVLRMKEATLNLWTSCYNSVKEEIEKAKIERRKPNVVSPFPVGKNDIIRKMENTNGDIDEYQKLLMEIQYCVSLAKHDLDMFFEERDATLEADGKLSQGVIDYEEIYSEKNWKPNVKEDINYLYDIFGERLVCATAHNGLDGMHGREFEAKGEAIHRMNPNIKHYGVRFHPTEHVPGIRRPRSLKSNLARTIIGLKDGELLTGVLAPDDSLFNNNDMYDNGGTPVFINAHGAPNERGYAMAKDIHPESMIRVFDELNLDGPKEKVKRKVR